MRYPDGTPPPAGTILFGGSVRGPVAVPGRYRVELTRGERSFTETFEIRKDPRLSTTREELQKQFDLLIQIRDRVSAAHDAVNRILAVEKELDAATARAKTVTGDEAITAEAENLRGKLDAVLHELIQLEIKRGNDVLSYPVGLNNEIASIGRVVAGADTAPTDQTYEAFRELSAELDGRLAKLENIMEKDVPAFNQRLREKRVPAIAVR